MLSGCDDSPTPPDSVPENSLIGDPDFLEPLELITDPFADVSLKGWRGAGSCLDMLSEAFSPDNCLMMQEFLSDPNILEGVNNSL